MKNSINLFLLFLGLILFSCEKEIQTVMTVQLNPTFITLGEGTNEPMRMKSEGINQPMKVGSVSNEESAPIYAIQVYENDVPYYYGLFNDISKMQIALTTSKTYKFKITAYKTGTGKGLKTLTDADGVNYYLPNKISLKNMFIKGDLLKDIDLTSSVILNGQQKDYPEVDGFYATKTITLEKGTTSIDFTLLRMGFGLNLNVDALTSGNMEVYLGNDTIKLNSSQTTASTVRLFNVLNGNFTNIHSKADTYGDSILLKVKWTGTNGTIVNTQRKYLFNRNYQKTINIQLNTLTNSLNFEGWSNAPKFIKIGPDANYKNIIRRSNGTFAASADLDVYEFADINSNFKNTNFTTQIGKFEPAELLGENSAGEIFRATYHNGIYKDSGNTWTFNGLSGYGTSGQCWTKLNNGRIIISKWGYLRNIFYSDDDGSHWTSAGLGYADWHNIIISNTGNIFASSHGDHIDAGLIKSTNNGMSWTYLDAKIPLNNAFSVSKDYSNNIYVLADNFLIYKSSDDGETWSLFNSIPKLSMTNSILLFTHNKIYLITQNGTTSKLYYSDLSSVNWIEITTQFPSETFFNQLKYIDNKIFVCTSKGLFYCQD